MDIPKRPPELSFHSLCVLYLHFERIFLEGQPTHHEFFSACGCKIAVFDHNFFHMVKLRLPGKEKLFMPEEKSTILSLTLGFGDYAYDNHRARHLLSARETLGNPDCVYRTEHLKTANRVFIKRYDSLPYQYTAVLVGIGELDLRVLVTAFPVRQSDLKRWLRGKRLFPKNTTATV